MQHMDILVSEESEENVEKEVLYKRELDPDFKSVCHMTPQEVELQS